MLVIANNGNLHTHHRGANAKLRIVIEFICIFGDLWSATLINNICNHVILSLHASTQLLLLLLSITNHNCYLLCYSCHKSPHRNHSEKTTASIETITPSNHLREIDNNNVNNRSREGESIGWLQSHTLVVIAKERKKITSVPLLIH